MKQLFKLPLILASSSPRRKMLLDTLNIPFSVEVPNVDEAITEAPDVMVETLSKRKALSIMNKHPHSIILGADTLVYCDKVLGKPKTPECAREMLSLLSNKWHEVYTGITLVNTETNKIMTESVMTRVHFVELSSYDIEEYIMSGEPLDKAGGYAIQERAEAFIDRIEGSYSNVVGLPLARLVAMIKQI